MKWILVNNLHSSLQEYHLLDDENCKVIIKYNPRHQSARITCGAHQRLFFIETNGSIKPKTVFKNEYGLEIGSLMQDNLVGNKGSVIINEKKYNYTLTNGPFPELAIYEKNHNEPIVSYGLKTNSSNPSIFLPNNTNNADTSCLLLGLCWYLFLPIAKETVIEYAM